VARTSPAFEGQPKPSRSPILAEVAPPELAAGPDNFRRRGRNARPVTDLSDGCRLDSKAAIVFGASLPWGPPVGSRITETNARLYRAVDEILHYMWDPIGVSGIPGAREEYQAYVPEVFRLLLDQGDEQAIADHLGRVATERLGMNPNRIRDLAAARAAVTWREFTAAQSPVSLPDA